MSTEKRTELSNLGEFGLIKHLSKQFKVTNKGTIVGVGDDAAILENTSKQIVVTTDILTEGIHFDLMYVPLKHLGYKAASVNFSDVYAMNARPTQITVSIAISNKMSLEAIDTFYEGILLACERHGVDVVGGDTTSSVSGITISITAIGEVEKGKEVLRSTAKEHDLICVSGNLGAAYMGLQILEREKQVFRENPNIQPDLAEFPYLVERQLKPEARGDIIQVLNKANVLPTSMIDISDGLASEILHIGQSSNVGCHIYEEKLPIDHETAKAAEELNLDPTICALNGGEDYELLFTIQQEDYEKIKAIKNISVIGHITEPSVGCQLVTRSGTQINISAQGWDALLKLD